jgi:hypothetical protein
MHRRRAGLGRPRARATAAQMRGFAARCHPRREAKAHSSSNFTWWKRNPWQLYAAPPCATAARAVGHACTSARAEAAEILEGDAWTFHLCAPGLDLGRKWHLQHLSTPLPDASPQTSPPAGAFTQHRFAPPSCSGLCVLGPRHGAAPSPPPPGLSVATHITAAVGRRWAARAPPAGPAPLHLSVACTRGESASRQAWAGWMAGLPCLAWAGWRPGLA